MASRIAVRRVFQRRFSSGSGKVLGEEEKAAETIYIKKAEQEKLEKLARKVYKSVLNGGRSRLSTRNPKNVNINWLLFRALNLDASFGAPRFIHGSAMISKSYYEVLGIPKDASLPKIKKAYYALAKKLHPDKNKNKDANDEAEMKFKEVLEAYEVLQDDENRKDYDQVGHDAFKNQESGGGGKEFHNPYADFFKMDNLFGQMFGGQDVKVSIELSCEEADEGCTKKLSIGLPCESGEVTESSIELNVMAGAYDNEIIVVPRIGGADPDESQFGHLFVTIKVSENDVTNNPRMHLAVPVTLMKYLSPMQFYAGFMKCRLFRVGLDSRIVCLDVGTDCIGISVSSRCSTWAIPIDTLVLDNYSSMESAAEILKNYADECNAYGIVISYPYLNGGISERGEGVKLLVDRLSMTGVLEDIPYTFSDESYSSMRFKRVAKPYKFPRNFKKLAGDAHSATYTSEVYLKIAREVDEGEYDFYDWVFDVEAAIMNVEVEKRLALDTRAENLVKKKALAKLAKLAKDSQESKRIKKEKVKKILMARSIRKGLPVPKKKPKKPKK